MRAVQIILGVVLGVGLLGTVWFMITAPTGDVGAPKAAPVETTQAPLRTDIPPPDTIVFDNKYGKSTSTHKLHYDRVKGDCTVCHTKIFPQSRAPLNYGKALHRAAEASQTACAACHRVGGTSFAADSNCVKCHEVKY
ncbi:MAG TPA: cytochrome c3 family protein [Bryobacteraceae bacterium]|nr:cytochrome c3 family protein [Bryobacteraceae bacterium]